MLSRAKLRAIKKHIAVLIKKKHYVVPHDAQHPKKWWFDSVIDPRSGESFTPEGAWDYIREKCEEKGTIIEEITLRKPPGKVGYVLRERTRDGCIYIKIQFGGHQGELIIGRSFHYEGSG